MVRVAQVIFAVFLCLVSSCDLSAKIEDHFNKAENKGEGHSLPGVDFIYMINLDERPEKFALANKELNPWGIYPYRFSAVNGWKLPFNTLYDVGLHPGLGVSRSLMSTGYYLENGEITHTHEHISRPELTYFCHCMSRGAVAIVLSHLSILQDAYDSGYNTIWVMEDDVKVIENPLQIPHYITDLDRIFPDWDVLFTDVDTVNNRGERVQCHGYSPRANFKAHTVGWYAGKTRGINKVFSSVGMRFGAYSMIVRRSGMKKILDYYKSYNIYLPYDMDFWLIPDIKMVRFNRDIVSTMLNAASDNGGPNYENKKE